MAAPTVSPQGATIAAAPVASQPWFKTSQRFLGRDWPTAYMFVLPMVLLLFGLIGYPFVRALYMSFYQYVGTRQGPFVGLDNYQHLFTDDFFIRSVGVTVTFTVVSVFFKFWLGIGAALLLHNIPRWGSVLGGLVLLPFIIPDVVRALAWRVLMDPLFGVLNYIFYNVLGLMSAPWPWLGDPATALPSVILVNIWAGAPFFIILVVAGLKAIDGELYDAASVDGATAWRRFLHITLPGLRYVIIVAALLSTIFTFNGFTLTYILTGGGPGGATRIYTVLAYEYARALRYGAATAVAMMVAPLLFMLILFLGRYMMRREDIAHSTAEDGALWRNLTGFAVPRGLGDWLRSLAVIAGVALVGAALYLVSLASAYVGLTAPLPWQIVYGAAVPAVILLLTTTVRILIALFWAVNGVAESIAGAAAAAVRSAGTALRLPPARTRRVGVTTMYALLGAILLFELLPFYFIFVTSFKSKLQIQQIQNMFWPTPWTLDNFRWLFTEIPFTQWYTNTVTVALVATCISVSVASLGAYGLVRMRWRGSNLLGTSVLIAYLMPTVLMFIPLYLILAQFRLINSLYSIMIIYPSVVLPFATWLMMGYYRSIPEELEDAAMIDGCNRFQAFYRVVLPLTRPALLAVAMFSVTQAWNEFLYAYMFLTKDEVLTLPVGLNLIIIGDVQPWGELMAASLLTAVPVVIIYMLGQRLMVAGLTAGSVKG